MMNPYTRILEGLRTKDFEPPDLGTGQSRVRRSTDSRQSLESLVNTVPHLSDEHCRCG